ncbi:oxidoreductase-like protein [Rhizodiscina lignyota]|uniref:Oxidoreductase-like protein n=1 Tax=Rhizodiscina lignyota TaxID=1504668 RepID=A0A9P4II32_9PEZI|nr:oxidoreductase-like protein [Rhizodiscina lignyota]
MAYPLIAPYNGASFTSTIHSDSYPFISKSNHRGHNVFITGGSRGIGRAIALSFAKAGAASIGLGDIVDDFGSLSQDVAAAARSAAVEPPKLVLTKLDVTKSASVSNAAELIKEEFNSRLDVIVNNAGFMTPALPVTESDEDTWWRTFEVNLKGVYLISKYFLPLLLDTNGGLKTLVNINSVASHNLRPMASAYGISKAAALRFTEFLLVEAADRGLLAYSVHPGGVLTELAEKGMPKETLAALGDTPEIAGDTVTWLTQERRDWLAGRYLSCTWDMEEILRRKEDIERGDLLKVRLIL